MIALAHGRISIALHPLREAPGPTLLCLHEVAGSAADFRDVAWPGRVFALDFSGHGRSGHVRGGSYYPETLAGDADAALARIGPAYLVGAGIGAYVALLLAGGRPEQIPGAVLLPGAGLMGGGEVPDWSSEDDAHARWRSFEPVPPGCDPAVRRLERDIRPRDYAREFALAARRLLLGEDGGARPPWWEAVRESPAAARAPAEPARALALLAASLG